MEDRRVRAKKRKKPAAALPASVLNDVADTERPLRRDFHDHLAGSPSGQSSQDHRGPREPGRRRLRGKLAGRGECGGGQRCAA